MKEKVLTNGYGTRITADVVRGNIKWSAKVYSKDVSNPIALECLSNWQEMGVKHFGMTWEEVEAIEIEGYKEA